MFIPELEFAHMHLRVASINYKPSHEFKLWINQQFLLNF
jgi:hypothetical protein